MTRFAIIPLAIFANACADSAGLDNVEDTEAEVRDLIEEYGADEERNAAHTQSLAFNLVQLANTKYANAVEDAGCTVVGAAYGQWHKESGKFHGQTFHNSAQTMANFRGKIRSQQAFGMVDANSFEDYENGRKLILEGEWHNGDFVADVFSPVSNNTTAYTIIGQAQDSAEGGQFYGALSICN